VRYVVHLDLPKSIESYYRRRGAPAATDCLPRPDIYGLNDVVRLAA